MLVAYQAAQEMIQALVPILPVIHRHDRKLADQMKEAANSVLLNIGEGEHCAGGDRIQHFRIAKGSAGEVRSALDAARAWQLPISDEVARARVSRVLGLLYGLIHGPKRFREAARS
jgi:four helix bundle protein